MRHDAEHQAQKAVISWAAAQINYAPELALLYAVPNGGHRNRVVAAKLKAEGVRRGVPDLCLPVPKRGHHALYIELKTASGRVSTEQQAWLNRLTRAGNAAVVCRGSLEAIATLAHYVNIDNPTTAQSRLP